MKPNTYIDKPFRFTIIFREDRVYAIATNVKSSILYGFINECKQSNKMIDLMPKRLYTKGYRHTI